MASGILVDRTVAIVDGHALPSLFASTSAIRDRPELIDPKACAVYLYIEGVYYIESR